MKFENILSIVGLSFLIACGGGGGSDTPSEIAAAPEPATTSPNVTNNLVAPANFGFKTSRSVDVNIQADQFSNERAYVSIYSQSRVNQLGEEIPIYDSKIAMLSLEGAQVSQSIMVTNDVQAVFIRVNGVSLSQSVYNKSLSIENDKISWSF